VPLGYVPAELLLPVVATATALNFNLIAPEVRLVPSPASVVVAVTLGIGVTMLAAWLPAARAVRTGIAMTTRGRGKEACGAARAPGWRAPAALAAAAVTAMVLQWPPSRRPAARRDGARRGDDRGGGVAARTTDRPPRPALMVRVAGASGRFAATGMRDHPRRVGMTTATIAVGVAAVAALGAGAELEGSVVDALGRAIRADLVVTSTNIGSGSSKRCRRHGARRGARRARRGGRGWLARARVALSRRAHRVERLRPAVLSRPPLREWPLKASLDGATRGAGRARRGGRRLDQLRQVVRRRRR
jgi:hypothetical protein